MPPPRRFVEPRRRRFRSHLLRRVFQGKENTYLRLLPIYDAAESPDIRGFQCAGLDRKDDLLVLSVPVVPKQKPPVDSLVRALLLLHRPGSDETERPPLELVRILLREFFRIRKGYRFPNHGVGLGNSIPKGIA